MTVVLHAVTKTFTGVAADSKPTDAPDGSRFFETDTGGVYIFSDSAWTILFPGADDAAFTVGTSPVTPIGALADEATPDSVDEGDVGALAMTLGRELYTRTMRRGSSEVKSIWKPTVSDSTTRATLVTPTSGKKIRIVAYSIFSKSATGTDFELYFAAGANISSTPAKAIATGFLDLDLTNTMIQTYPDGGGPVGAVDDLLSIRTQANISGSGIYVVHYREE